MAALFIILLYLIGIAACIGIIIYLIIKRIEKKGNEGFEERDW
ncbi:MULTISPECIES: hypothetical protein [Nonlabens]|uniref:Uncharacterized protein n=1 Tax=Nonlabens ulvanivorans TaxID=906888 RepID=A0A081D9V9_NONUL|nr:hypothetical protein [Nonlabens ulvanivorans]PRX12834.1 hypothetical protein LY02_02486 [Nonlabens ulvanivorans]GAK75705.1 hypothetical protein JCM19296_1297 [Nonlabens ulvanivorans]GAL00469.1 hypothetical protein JCM19314_2077 [Nonlabens ulvanivorans]GAL75431.1 hypothetical protein JCM19275_1882 [Nonlabens ulvanivorans]